MPRIRRNHQESISHVVSCGTDIAGAALVLIACSVSQFRGRAARPISRVTNRYEQNGRIRDLA